MGLIESNEKLVSRPKIGLDGFETIVVGFCKCTANVIVAQFFNKFSLQEIFMTIKLSNG